MEIIRIEVCLGNKLVIVLTPLKWRRYRFQREHKMSAGGWNLVFGPIIIDWMTDRI